MKKILFILINILVAELIGIIFYTFTSRNAYEKSSYWTYISKPLATTLPLLTILNALLIKGFNLGSFKLFLLMLLFIAPWMTAEPLIIDYFFGDIIHDYYLRTGNKNLLNFKHYLSKPNTLYSIKKTLTSYGINVRSIETPENSSDEDNNLYYINNRYYILLSEDKQVVLNKIDERDVINKYIEDLENTLEFKNIVNKNAYPFFTSIECNFINNKSCTLSISIFEEDGKICVTSEKIIKTKA